jgi:formylglycine-generating enzyme required for sulfatase activity
MKKRISFLSIAAAALLAACSGSDHGELVGVQNRPEWYPSDPFGMVYVPQGSFNMGNTDVDVPFGLTAPTKTVSVSAFYMDETEITNNEYRQFVYWVRDSILRFRLAEAMVEEYEYINYADMENPTFFEEYVGLNYPDSMQTHLDWKPSLSYDTRKYPSAEYTEVIESLYLAPEEIFMGGRMVDARQLNYLYFWMDKQKASRKSNRAEYNFKDAEDPNKPFSYRDYVKDGQQITDRSSFFEKEIINVYPDTLVWIADFTYSFNETMHDKYFWHPAYDNYPVVGVNWKQAVAFANWRTKYRSEFLRANIDMQEHEFRLPTESEWEYAARGGRELTTYPWGGPYATNSSGCFLANFKPSRGNLVADGGFHPVKATSYQPNGFGLYCMAGNVAEWTSTAWEEASYYYVADFNPDYKYNAKEGDSETLKRKVIRGGSWKDIAHFMQNGSRSYEYQDTSKSFVGFRTVQSFLGRDLRDF